MKAGVVVFPGTNCEHDVAFALRSLGAEAELVWHRETSLDGLDGVVLPGGFAHGDYLRTGAIARFSPVMTAVAKAAEEGVPVLGICNGFQVLCEAGLLPGALIHNRDLQFICKPVHLRVESTGSILTAAATEGEVLRIPLNSYEGNYIATGPVNTQLTYCAPDGTTTEEGNVAGLMPHPERAIELFMGSTDGRLLLEGFVAAMEPARA